VAGWTVLYEDALAAWEAEHHPDTGDLIAVLTWLMTVTDSGPPDDHVAVPLTEDLFVSRVEGAGVLVTYLALAYERRMVARRIGRT
jgi:hypothetical protein